MEMTKMIPLQPTDRVLVVVDGKIVEARVAEVSGFAVKVTRNKEDEGLVFERDQVFPLYRKEKLEKEINGETMQVRAVSFLFDVK